MTENDTHINSHLHINYIYFVYIIYTYIKHILYIHKYVFIYIHDLMKTVIFLMVQNRLL